MPILMVCTLLLISIFTFHGSESLAESQAKQQPRGSSPNSSALKVEAVPSTATTARIDFGVTSDDFGATAGCLSMASVTTQYVFEQSIVFGAAVDFPGRSTGAVVTVTDGACSPSCRSSGSPPFFTDWWCQFSTGSAPGVPEDSAGVDHFSAELCLIDEPEKFPTLMVAYDIDGNVIDSASPIDGPSVQTLEVQDSLLQKRICYVQIVSSADLAGLTVDYLDYDDPQPIATGVKSPTIRGIYLSNSYPNPCNPSTTINYRIAGFTRVHLAIYDTKGRLVRTLVDEEKAPRAGGFSVVWNGRDNEDQVASSGVYFYRLTAGQFSQTKKLVLIK